MLKLRCRIIRPLLPAALDSLGEVAVVAAAYVEVGAGGGSVVLFDFVGVGEALHHLLRSISDDVALRFVEFEAQVGDGAAAGGVWGGKVLK